MPGHPISKTQRLFNYSAMYPMVYNTEGFELYCRNVPIYVRFQTLDQRK